MKIKDMKMSGNRFGERGIDKGNVNPSPKKQYNLLSDCDFILGCALMIKANL